LSAPAATRARVSARGAAAAGLAALAALLRAGAVRTVPATFLGAPALVALPALLAAALSWNVGARLRTRRARRPRPAATFYAQLEWTAADDVAGEAERLARLLRRGGYRVVREAAGGAVSLCGRRGDVGFWGSIGFHLAVALAAVAVTLTTAAQRNGAVTLVEGVETRLDDPAATRVDRRGPLAAPLPPVPLELTGFAARFVDDRFPVEYRAEIRARDGAAARSATIRVNDPVVVAGHRLTLQRYGIAPVLDVRTRAGETVVRAPVLLSVLEGKSDDFVLPGEGAWLRARYLGDLVDDGLGHASSRSDEPRNPALLLTPLSADRAHPAGPTLLLRRGEAATIGAHRIEFPELRHWVELGVDRDPGMPVLVVAAVLACAGLALRFWDHEREVRLRIAPEGRGARVAAASRSRYFPALTRLALERLRGDA
jgi:cytochrome c biogenesis protein ResB